MLARQELDLREIDRADRGADVQMLDKFAGDFRVDALPCLFGGTAGSWSQNEVVKTL